MRVQLLCRSSSDTSSSVAATLEAWNRSCKSNRSSGSIWRDLSQRAECDAVMDAKWASVDGVHVALAAVRLTHENM